MKLIPAEFQRFVDFLSQNPSPSNVVPRGTYQVPCASLPGERWGGLEYVPLLGTLHEDAEIIGFPAWHIHVDTRFIPEKESWIANFYGIDTPFPVAYSDGAPRIGATATLSVLPLVAQRAQPMEFPLNVAGWQILLEERYKDCRVSGGLCPHRQIPLLAGRDVGNGVRQCPGHGLCWDSSGKIHRRHRPLREIETLEALAQTS